jgi:catechol 2,3-dioxygenase-like lactoylglutathione lyase family enzyme
MLLNTRHTGLVIRDLEKSMEFYIALGFKLHAKRFEEGHFIETVVGISEVRLEWAKLSAPDGSLLELLQYHSHPAEAPVAQQAANQLGCSHIAFTVEDVEEVCQVVSTLGGSIVNNPVVSPDGAARVAYCHDPDGILMELVQENRS